MRSAILILCLALAGCGATANTRQVLEQTAGVLKAVAEAPEEQRPGWEAWAKELAPVVESIAIRAAAAVLMGGL